MLIQFFQWLINFAEKITLKYAHIKEYSLYYHLHFTERSQRSHSGLDGLLREPMPVKKNYPRHDVLFSYEGVAM